MTATAVGFCRESFFFSVSTTGAVVFFGRGCLFPRGRVDVERAELLTAFPAPGAATASPYGEAAFSLEAARKDIVTCGIFEGPALAPWALFRICRHSAVSDTKN